MQERQGPQSLVLSCNTVNWKARLIWVLSISKIHDDINSSFPESCDKLSDAELSGNNFTGNIDKMLS